MKLETLRLLLYPLSVADIPNIHTLNSEPEVARFNTIGIPGNIRDTEKLLRPLFNKANKEKRNYSWAIRSRESDVFIGEIGMSLSPKRYKMGKLFYNLLPNFWGQGYATEAVNALLHFAFTELNLHRMEAGCAVDNLASIRVLEKVGMQREGRRRKVLPLRDGWSDNFEFAILEEDYIPL